MADLTANVDAWSSTEDSNSPTGATTIGTNLDNNLRAIQAGVKLWQERMNAGFSGNLSLSFSVGSSALTIALKGKDGTDPSSTNKVIVPFRNVTAATGDYSFLTATAATSLVISSGSTLGTASSTAFRLWVVAFNDGDTLRLGAINCVSTSAGAGTGRDVTAIYPLSAWGIASSTAEGGAGGADSAQTFYTGSAVASKVYAVLGYATWESGLGTAGTWSAGPTRAQLYGPGVPLPGQTVQVRRTPTGASATTTSATPAIDDSIPQISEGGEFMTQVITPASAANAIQVKAAGWFSVDDAGVGGIASFAMFKDATANAVVAGNTFISPDSAVNIPTRCELEALLLSEGTAAQSYSFRLGIPNGTTARFNGGANSGSRQFGGVANSYMQAEEIMG